MSGAAVPKLEGFGTTIFTRDDATRQRARRDQPRAGVPGLRRPGLRQGGCDRGDPRGPRTVRADERAARRSTRALSVKYRRDYGLDYAADTELTVCSGATEAIFAAIQGDLRRRRRGRPLRAVLRLLQGERRAWPERVPRFVRCARRTGASTGGGAPRAFREDTGDPAPELAAQSDRQGLHARGARVPSPASAASATSICVTDEVYEHLVYDGHRHVPMAALPGCASARSRSPRFGKTFSLTGWKIGWAAAPPELTAAVRAAHQFITFATATPAPASARRRPSRRVRNTTPRLAAEYLARRDYLVGDLSRIGFDVTAPAGTYFACADFRPFGFDDDSEVRAPPDRGVRRRRHPAERLLRGLGPAADLRALCVLQEARDPRGGRRAAGRPRRATGRSPRVKIALVQLDLAWEDVEENHRRARKRLEEARSKGAGLALLPEMFCTGFSMDAARHRAALGRTVRDVLERHRSRARPLDPRERPRGRNAAAPQLAILAGPDGSRGEVRQDPSVHVRRRRPRLFRRGPHRHGLCRRSARDAVRLLRPALSRAVPRWPRTRPISSPSSPTGPTPAGSTGAPSCAPARSRTSATSPASTAWARVGDCAMSATPPSSRRGERSSPKATPRKRFSSQTSIPRPCAKPARSFPLLPTAVPRRTGANRRLRLRGDLRPSAAPAVRSPKRGSTDGLVSSLRFGSRGANLLPPSGRETIRAANDTDAASKTETRRSTIE